MNFPNENHWSHRGVSGTVAGAAVDAASPGILYALDNTGVRFDLCRVVAQTLGIRCPAGVTGMIDLQNF